jgi:hypothetical protein
MRKVITAFIISVFLLVSGRSLAERLPIIELIEPISSKDVKGTLEYRTTATVIKVVGIASSDSDVVEVTLNGTPAQISSPGARDLILTQVAQRRSVRFQGEVSIPQNKRTEIRIVARDTRGRENRRAIVVVHERLDLPSKLGRRWALIVGIENYEDPNIADLNYSVDDAKLLYEVLVDPDRGGFDPGRVRLLTDDAQDPSLRPTRRNILRALRNWLRGAKPEDTVLFYFSGHGIADAKGRNYLVAIDSTLDLLEDTAVSMRRVNELLSDRKVIRARKIIAILDTCHSGARVGSKAVGELGQVLDPLFTKAEGRITLASCGIDEQSFEDPQKGHGVFTYYLVEGLKGEADVDLDGVISATEVSNYVFNAVREWAWRHGRKQTPRREANLAGEIWLARDPNVRMRRLKRIYRSGRMTDAEYNEALTLLGKDRSELTDVEATCLKALEDLLSGKTTLETYRLIVMRAKGLGVLRIETDPPGAAIFLNGKYVGVTPRNIGGQRKGDYDLELTKDGFVPIRMKVHIRAGETKRISQELVRFGHVQVTSSPRGARVMLDGKYTGKLTPATLELPPGRYRIGVSLPGEPEREKEVLVESGSTVKVRFDLIRRGYGELIIDADPWAEVFLDGKRVGYTPLWLKRVTTGRHKLRFTNPDHPDIEREIILKRGEVGRVKVRFKKS